MGIGELVHRGTWTSYRTITHVLSIFSIALLLLPVALAASVVNTSGDVITQGGAFVTGGTARVSSTGVGTFASGTTVAGIAVCLADGTNCPAQGMWRNTTAQVYLASNSSAVKMGLVDNVPVFSVSSSLLVGVRKNAVASVLDINGTGSNISLWVVGGVGRPAGGINLTGGIGAAAGIVTNAGVGGEVALAAGNGGDGDEAEPGFGGNVSIAAGDGGSGVGVNAHGGNVILTPGIEGDTIGGAGNGSVIVTRGTVIIGETPERESDTSFYRLNVLGNSNLSGNMTITSGGLSIGSAPTNALLSTESRNFSASAAEPHGITFTHTVYGSTSFQSGVYMQPLFQLSGNVSSLTGVIVAPSLRDSTKNVTRLTALEVGFNNTITYNGTANLVEGLKFIAPGVSNGSITDYVGIDIEDVDLAGEKHTIKGIMSQISQGTGRHNLYLDGTAANYLEGNVSFGQDEPSAQVDITGAEAAAHGLLAAFEIQNTASGGGIWYMRAGATGTATPAGGFSIASSLAYMMSITSGGLVGIGSLAPTSTLYVLGDANVTDVLSIRESEIRQGFSSVNYTAGAVSTNSVTAYTRLNMSLNLSANSRYIIDCDLISDSSAAGGGITIGINFTGTPTQVRATYSSVGPTASGALSVETFSGTSTTTNAFADAASSTDPYVAEIDGYVVTDASNSVVWHVDMRSETNLATATVREGSYCRATRVGDK